MIILSTKFCQITLRIKRFTHGKKSGSFFLRHGVYSRDSIGTDCNECGDVYTYRSAGSARRWWRRPGSRHTDHTRRTCSARPLAACVQPTAPSCPRPAGPSAPHQHRCYSHCRRTMTFHSCGPTPSAHHSLLHSTAACSDHTHRRSL